MQEIQVQSLGQEDPLKNEAASHSSILAWGIPRTEELVSYSPWGCKESDTAERLNNNNPIAGLGGPQHTQMPTIKLRAPFLWEHLKMPRCILHRAFSTGPPAVISACSQLPCCPFNSQPLLKISYNSEEPLSWRPEGWCVNSSHESK